MFRWLMIRHCESWRHTSADIYRALNPDLFCLSSVSSVVHVLHLSSSEREFPAGQAQQRIKRGQQIIGHHTQAIMNGAIEMPDRHRFDNVEQAEQRECERLPNRRVGGEI